MAYQSESIANYFISRSLEEGNLLTNMKLQKLVYFADAYSMAIRDKDIVSENPEAWDYGPVYPDLYHMVKHYGSGPIRKPIVHPFSNHMDDPWCAPEDSSDVAFLKALWDHYKSYSAIRLSEMSHASGGPWDETYKKSRGGVIDKRVMKSYFQKKLEMNE